MSIVATCSCGKSFLAKPELAGQFVRCPSCGSGFVVPAAPAPGTKPDPLAGSASPWTLTGSLASGASPVRLRQSTYQPPKPRAKRRTTAAGESGVGKTIGRIALGVLLGLIILAMVNHMIVVPIIHLVRGGLPARAAREG